jgi:hypothetical protein
MAPRNKKNEFPCLCTKRIVRMIGYDRVGGTEWARDLACRSQAVLKLEEKWYFKLFLVIKSYWKSLFLDGFTAILLMWLLIIIGSYF